MDNEMLKVLKQALTEEFEPIKNDIIEMKTDIKELKLGQDEIKQILVDIETKNANRHLELEEKLSDIDKNLNLVENVTAKNWSDISNLKRTRI